MRMQYTFAGFTKESDALLCRAIDAAQELGHTYVGTEHLLLALLRQNTEAAAFLAQKNITGVQVGQLMLQQIGQGHPTRLSPRDFTQALCHCLDRAFLEGRLSPQGKAAPQHLLGALLEAPATAGRMLAQLGTQPTAVAKEYGRSLGKTPLFAQQPHPAAGMRGTAHIAEKYGRDLTALAERDQLDPVFGRDEELLRMEQILVRRRKNNPCLVGEPGVGKTAVVEGLARRIAAGQAPPQLCGKRILSLDTSYLA